MAQWALFTDGGSRGNPGHAAYGFALFDEQGQEVYSHAACLGIKTNNEAEYFALIAGLQKAREYTAVLTCFLDSALVVHQVTGTYRITKEHLKELCSEVHRHARAFSSITYHAIPREKNKRADYLVNEVLDAPHDCLA